MNTNRQKLQEEIQEEIKKHNGECGHPTLIQTRAILTVGLRHKLIDEKEAETAEQSLISFLSLYPTYKPRTPREKRTQDPPAWLSEEDEMWLTVQPILDKAQGVEPVIKD